MNKKPMSTGKIAAITVAGTLAGVGLVGALVAAAPAASQVEAQPAVSVSATPTPTPMQEFKEEPLVEEYLAPEPVVEVPAPNSGISVSQSNAVRTAENYLSFMDFSRQGLIDQLEFEGYSTEEATAAVDSLDVDWNAQAAKSAAAYQDFMAFSRQGMIDQLMYEGYTYEQATYGVNSVGL